MLEEGSREEFLGVERKRDYWEWIVVLKNCYYIPDFRGNWVSTAWIMYSNEWIPDSSLLIPDSFCRDSGFHSKKYVGFRILDSLTRGD